MADCVEVASTARAVLIRNSKDVDGAVLVIDAVEWLAFLEGVRKGDFDS